MLQPVSTSPWPKIRARFGALVRDVYAEAVCEGAILINKVVPANAPPGVPTLRVSVANSLVRMLALVVASVGRVERAILGDRGIKMTELREASADELRQKAGQLRGEGMLPSAYDVWLGPRSDGRLRMRCSYDGPRLSELLDAGGALDAGASAERVCAPVPLDKATTEWVRRRIATPAADSRLQVWRAMKKRLYHYDAGVYAFHGFPRNYLLSPQQWADLLEGRPRGASGAALDVGAGDGSLTEAFAHLFARTLATEMTVPLVCRLRADGLEAVVTDTIDADCVRDAPLDVAFVLNVLDRCKDPELLLRQVHALLPVDGWLVVSVVLPATQSDAAYGRGARQRKWAVRGADWEAAASSLVCDLLRPAGFSPLRLARAPYLCAGDRYSPVAALDACVVVLRRYATPRHATPRRATRKRAQESARERKRALARPRHCELHARARASRLHATHALLRTAPGHSCEPRPAAAAANAATAQATPSSDTAPPTRAAERPGLVVHPDAVPPPGTDFLGRPQSKPPTCEPCE